MAVIALCSASGSPGVTTTSLGLALLWPRPVLLVEADPTGGSGILAGYFRGIRAYDQGLVELALSSSEVADLLPRTTQPIGSSTAGFIAGTARTPKLQHSPGSGYPWPMRCVNSSRPARTFSWTAAASGSLVGPSPSSPRQISPYFCVARTCRQSRLQGRGRTPPSEERRRGLIRPRFSSARVSPIRRRKWAAYSDSRSSA